MGEEGDQNIEPSSSITPTLKLNLGSLPREGGGGPILSLSSQVLFDVI